MKLTIDNSVCQLSGLSNLQFRRLTKLLCVETETSRSRYLLKRYWKYRKSLGTKRTKVQHARQIILWKSYQQALKRTYLINHRGEFPTGLLYIVEKFLGNKTHERNDQRTRPAPHHGLFKLVLPYSPYPEQIEAAEACQRAGRGIVAAVTALGKSTIAALIVEKVQVKTLIVVPKVGLRKQLTADMVKMFPGNAVGRLKDCPDIAIENVDALDVRGIPTEYQCVIIDEFHHGAAKTYRQLNKKTWGHIYYKFGLTATPFRSDESERLLLESVISQIIYRIPYQLAVDKGYIAPVEAYYVDLDKIKMKGDPENFAEVYDELIVDREDRNEIISQVLQLLKAQNIPTLCLVKRIPHGEALQMRTDITIPFVKGENDDNSEVISAFNSGELDMVIGTDGVVGEGMDTKRCEWVILAGGGKSKNGFMQRVGRVLRRSPGKECGRVLLFRDSSHKWLEEHFQACVRYLKEEYGIEPYPLELSLND